MPLGVSVTPSAFPGAGDQRSAQAYDVKSGDTRSDLALELNVTVDAIAYEWTQERRGVGHPIGN